MVTISFFTALLAAMTATAAPAHILKRDAPEPETYVLVSGPTVQLPNFVKASELAADVGASCEGTKAIGACPVSVCRNRKDEDVCVTVEQETDADAATPIAWKRLLTRLEKIVEGGSHGDIVPSTFQITYRGDSDKTVNMTLSFKGDLHADKLACDSLLNLKKMQEAGSNGYSYTSLVQECQFTAPGWPADLVPS